MEKGYCKKETPLGNAGSAFPAKKRKDVTMLHEMTTTFGLLTPPPHWYSLHKHSCDFL